MKFVYSLLLVLLLCQCNREPAPTPKLLKKLTVSGAVFEFSYKDNKLSSLVCTKADEYGIINITRSPNGHPLRITANRNGFMVLDHSFETDSQGRITKIIRKGNLLFTNRYDSQGNLTAQTASVNSQPGSVLYYTGQNMTTYEYDLGGGNLTRNGYIITQFDDYPNPLYELNAANGFIFPLKIQVYLSLFLEDYYNVFTRNNQLVLFNRGNGKTVFRYEYEYENSLPIKRKVFKPGPNDTMIEDVASQVLYEY
ncbi:hypothetical protein LX87_02299 [Larkinella arboricola]|uniref:Uncharacterized protein n=1 Tax=Larkinella arboricola TaxID=643671 RepID=A0A327WW90_LARAB|nr:hypothetical protein [Larkinella arboricola]RAJ97399.1 hypothetical protein LX87_02299 [Larkinella arboricola]